MRPGPLRVGQDFGPRYHVVKLLGSGGMGVVYQALDRELGVEIALKVLRAPAASGAKGAASVLELQRRFKTELLLARQITHRHVIRIHDIGEINGIRFISMPLVQGPDFASLLKNGPLSVSRAVRYARQIASALVAVHAAGVVHRDLKPANIMLGADDHALLMDFGIARSTAPAAAPRTIPGAVVGTMAYMAPEQARGEDVDRRSDIYAFGLILSEMLSGGGRALSMADVMARMKAPPRAVRHLNPKVPPALDAIVTRCLQPAPRDRYQTAAELAAALAALTRHRRGALGADAARRWARAAAAMLAIAALSALVLWLRSPAAEAAFARGGAMIGRSLEALNDSTLLARERPVTRETVTRSTVSARGPEPRAATSRDSGLGTRDSAAGDRARARGSEHAVAAARPPAGAFLAPPGAPRRGPRVHAAHDDFRSGGPLGPPSVAVAANHTTLERRTQANQRDVVSATVRGGDVIASLAGAAARVAPSRQFWTTGRRRVAYAHSYLRAWRDGEIEAIDEFQVCYAPHASAAP